MTTKALQGNQPMASINVTPLVDVMLVLLIIFMITAPMMTQRMSLNLVGPPLPKTLPEIEPLELQILVDGRVVLDGKTLAPKVFAAEIAHIATWNEPPGINIAVAEQTEYRHVVDALAVIKGEGIRRISFVDTIH